MKSIKEKVKETFCTFDFNAPWPHSFTVKNLAKLLEVSPVTVQKWIRDNNIQADKVSGHWSVKTEGIRQYLDRIAEKADGE